MYSYRTQRIDVAHTPTNLHNVLIRIDVGHVGNDVSKTRVGLVTDLLALHHYLQKQLRADSTAKLLLAYMCGITTQNVTLCLNSESSRNNSVLRTAINKIGTHLFQTAFGASSDDDACAEPSVVVRHLLANARRRTCYEHALVTYTACA